MVCELVIICVVFRYLGGHLWQSEGSNPSFALEMPFQPGQGFHLPAVPHRRLQRFTVEPELLQAWHPKLLIVVVLQWGRRAAQHLQHHFATLQKNPAI